MFASVALDSVLISDKTLRSRFAPELNIIQIRSSFEGDRMALPYARFEFGFFHLFLMANIKIT